MNNPLEKARIYEASEEKNISPSERPAFHLSSRVGWMNDPNGFSIYKGKYHLFYQYHPYGTYWGPMHWGHAISEDLLHWEYLPAAMAPDKEYDSFGCFSGSAIELPDGRHLIMYTAVKKIPMEDGSEQECQTQALAIGDGTDYVKYEHNPILTGTDLPDGCSHIDFRDPKIFQKEDGGYACVIGNRPLDGSGQILLFESDDGFDWMFTNVLIKNENRFGKMWECPDFFPLDDSWVLITSPQDMHPCGNEYRPGNGTLCLIGDYSKNRARFTERSDQAIDHGFDFYAPQTILHPDGRRIMIGWMQNWDTCNQQTEGKKWFGQTSLPRELSIVNDHLYQKPIRELEALRKNKVEYSDVYLAEEIRLSEVYGRTIDVELELTAETPESPYVKFEIRFAQNDTCHTAVIFRPYEETVTLDRRFSGGIRDIVNERTCDVPGSRNGHLKLRIILDRFSAEIFINDGYKVMSTSLYTPSDAVDISFSALGKAHMRLIKYDLTEA